MKESCELKVRFDSEVEVHCGNGVVLVEDSTTEDIGKHSDEEGGRDEVKEVKKMSAGDTN